MLMVIDNKNKISFKFWVGGAPCWNKRCAGVPRIFTLL